MTVERWLRLIAGLLVMLSLALVYWVDPEWHYFTAFVGANLSVGVYDWCLTMSILKRLGVSHA